MLEDAIGGKLKKSLLYKLSLNGVLGLFRKVMLVSSPKDMYVPTYSARIQVFAWRPNWMLLTNILDR